MCALKILSVDDVRKTDAYTIAHEPVSSVDLMERAGNACFKWIKKTAGSGHTFKIICGTGNNGGDGLVIARLLHQDNYAVEVFVVRYGKVATADFEENFNRLADVPGLVISDVYEQYPEIEIEEEDIVIDALLGSGLSRPLSGLLATVAEQINRSEALVVSIDLPTGLFADAPVNPKNTIVKADYTLSFQLPKMAFFIPENETYTGRWEILDIGLDQGFIDAAECNRMLIELQDCANLYRPRSKFAHKGSFGHALLMAGQTGSFGAAILSAKACLRSGVGLLTAHVPGDGFLIMQSTVPEAMVSIDNEDTSLGNLPDLEAFNAIGVGPGIGKASETQAMLKLLIQQAAVPMVLDADALNILAENKTWLAFLPPGSILTPHLKEFERLTSKTDNHYDRLELLQAFAVRFKLFVVLKGAYSALATPDGQIYFNPTGNPGMATGGSGDVLTGIILGLLASGYPARDACLLGLWVHGKAGDLAANKMGYEALLAGDIIEYLGKAFKKLY